MGGLMSRNKGKLGEREVRDLFREALKNCMDDTDVIRRNHQQAEIGGADLVGVPLFSVEIKRYKTISFGKQLEDWWDQCVEQAETDKKAPCLVFRQDRGPWFVMIYALPFVTEKETLAQPMITLWSWFDWFLQTHITFMLNQERKDLQ